MSHRFPRAPFSASPLSARSNPGSRSRSIPHPILTGKIVLAHLKETLDYYARLRVAEIEGDMLRALIDKNSEKLMQKYRLWVAAKADLANRERESSRNT